MKRWGFIGLLGLAACMPDESSNRDALQNGCPGITAGMLPGKPEEKLSNDGRERVIVRYRRERAVTAARVNQLGGRVTAAFRSAPALAVSVTPEERLALEKDPAVERIEPDYPLHAQGPARLPALALLSGGVTRAGVIAGEYTQELSKVQAAEVWDRDGDGRPDPGAVTGQGVKVCVIDSGLDIDHPELKDSVVAARDFMDGDDVPTDGAEGRWGTGHGTHVAGIIAARPGAGGRGTPVLGERGLVGVAPGVQLIIARVLDLDGGTHMSIVMQAVEYCQEQGAKVISLSIAGGMPTYTSAQVFQAARDSGILVVAAAGNEGRGEVSYPASDPAVLAVGALDVHDQRATFSSYGEALALMAPGVDVLSTFPRGLGSFAMVDVDGTRPMARSLLYAPQGETWGTLVDCGGGMKDSCGEGASCRGFIAYVHPSAFVSPERAVVNVMMQGARGVIFASELMSGGAEIISLPRRGHWVPAVTINQAASTLVEQQLGSITRLGLHPVDYAYLSGTSMATPYVSGIAALLFSARPSATPAEVIAALLASAKDLGPRGVDREYGHGLVQARGAMDALVGPTP
ncbi:S8 family serine peptidase [Myxococcus landrumensis]|uniref:S8 family serine peptidase n=1 Tax=Myxococcus landrumensis TaxID=2813577 RepID=A0ABX7N141_9BACT|nr:S8 family serine peptidase [Myxococcus landrumus]QSQ12216.1 S8 family serine peptidase [Myxococcus landrumus]